MTSDPLPAGRAWRAVARCAATTVGLLAGRRIAQPREHLGEEIRFADGSLGTVYRETVVRGRVPVEPAVLVVGFRLRGVHGRAHTWFRYESLLNTPLFVGFPGFVSKLWLAHDDHEVYRGVYQWDGASRAEHYARALWRVLALVSVRGSIRYRVLPGLWRDELLARPELAPTEGSDWWRPIPAVTTVG